MYDDCIFLSLRFPQKLWRIVNECKSGAIRWSLTGNTILLDYKKFQEQYLDAGNSIFKTKNITSFIRQLNLYGFRKVTSHNRDPLCNSHNPDVHEFLHENFRTGRPDLLSMVYRKTSGKSKHYQRSSTKNLSEPDLLSNDTNERVSRLHMCRVKKFSNILNTIFIKVFRLYFDILENDTRNENRRLHFLLYIIGIFNKHAFLKKSMVHIGNK